MMDTASLLWGVLFGSIGMGYLVYARRQRAPVALVSGLGLVVFTYFVSGTWTTLLVGSALMALPFLARRWLAWS
jgi:hypothetical protein